MAVLYLLRHAKSSWDDPDVADVDRPLAPRGRRAVVALAHHAQAERIRPDLVVCSPARRARDTLAGLADALGRPETVVDERVYLASETDLLARLRELPDRLESAMLVGHNPGIGLLIALLVAFGAPADVPTGALATLAFAGPWRQLGPRAAALDAYVVPRRLPGP